MSSKLFATQTQNFIECSKRHRFRKTNEYIQISYKKLNTAADVGTMYHSALENLLSIENLKKDTISDYISKYCSDDSNGIHSDFANSIEGRDAVYYLYNLIAKVKSIEDNTKLSNLLRNLNIPIKKVAIEINQRIVDKKKLNKIILKKNDKVEIVHFIGGG